MFKIKKIIEIIVICVILFCFNVSTLTADSCGVDIVLNEEKIIFSQQYGFPFIDENNRTLVPFRITLEEFGAEVSWDKDTNSAVASKGGITVIVPIGENYIYKNKTKIYNDTSAIIKDGRTYLPIRKVMEAFNCDVKWNSKNSNVLITTNDFHNNTYRSEYKIIYNALLNVKDKVVVNTSKDLRDSQINLDEELDRLTKIFEKVIKESPEIFYKDEIKGISLTIDDNIMTLGIKYAIDKKSIINMKKVFDQKVQSIMDDIISEGMKDYEKEKAIHDYIVNNTVYKLKNNNSYNAYGILVERSGVCQGYAEATKVLLDNVNIDSIIVCGEAKSEGRPWISHAWNIVNLEGEYYHLDTTWDDPVMNDRSSVLNYDYFNVTDKEISKTHRWTSTNHSCDEVKYNYHNYNNMIVKDYNSLVQYINKKINNKETKFEVKVMNSKNYNITDIMKEHTNVRSFKYSINKDLGIIKVFDIQTRL